MTTLLLIFGTAILLIVIHDFFYTTLSASGAGFISEHVAISSDKLIQFCVKVFGRKSYNYSGLFVNLMILLSWLLLIWAGLFLVYSSNPEAITNSSGRPANNWERLYFTGYTLSTLGMGNFKPTSAFFELLTSCFSFFGFIFFTSSITYFLSVSSAVVNKRAIAKSVYNIGDTPERIAKKILAVDSSYSYQQLLNLQEMVDRHCVNHQAYPVVHFYSRPVKKDCFSINLARLDEALTILIQSGRGKNLEEELKLLQSTILHFLQDLDANFARSLPQVEDPIDPQNLLYNSTGANSQESKERRRIIESLLKSESFGWKEVVNEEQS